jgi:hypothetical protein
LVKDTFRGDYLAATFRTRSQQFPKPFRLPFVLCKGALYFARSMALKKYLTWNFLLVVLIQYVGFKLSWLAAAYGAVEGPPWSYYGAIPFLVWLAIHVAYYRKFWELWYALSVGLMGTIIDTCYASTGFIVYNGPYPCLGLPGAHVDHRDMDGAGHHPRP